MCRTIVKGLRESSTTCFLELTTRPSCSICHARSLPGIKFGAPGRPVLDWLVRSQAPRRRCRSGQAATRGQQWLQSEEPPGVGEAVAMLRAEPLLACSRCS